MPNPKSDERVRAEQMYRESKGSIKLVDIAARLAVPPSKVRKWKSLDGWDKQNAPEQGPKKKQVERSTSSKGSVPLDDVPPTKKKAGAPLGNKNAKGGPPRNQKAVKHGIYKSPFADLLEDRDQEVYDGVSTSSDEEERLVETIALLTVRERWLIQKIQQIQQAGQGTRGLLVNSVNRSERKREFDGNAEDELLYGERQRAKVEAGDKLPGRDINISTTTVESSDLLLRAHGELTRVQSQKTRCIETLNKIRQSRTETKGNSMANDWIMALIGGDVEDE